MMGQNSSVTTVILAGGLGTRIGGNKGLQSLHSRPLISWVLDAIKPDSKVVVINANDEQGVYATFGCRVISDHLPDWPGPLAGLHAALLCSNTEYVMTVPCDTPFLPDNLLKRLIEAQELNTSEAAVALVGGYRQPTIALYNRNVLAKLEDFLSSGKRKVNDWLESLRLSEVVFDNVEDFENVNTLDDLARVQKLPIRAGKK